MYQGFEPIIPVTEEPASPEAREQARENFRVLAEIADACDRGDAALVKRLAALIVVPE